MMKDLPIIALDFESKEKVNQFLDLFDESLFVKSRYGTFLSRRSSIN